MNIFLCISIYLSMLVLIGYGAPVINPSNPTGRQGCRLQVVCIDTSTTEQLEWTENNVELTTGGNILIEHSVIPGGGYQSILTFLKLLDLGQRSFRCDAASGDTFGVTVTVIAPIQSEELPDIILDRYVEGQGYFVPCTVQSCIWPVEIRWDKDGSNIFTQTLTAEETGSLSRRTGLLDTVLDMESEGTYSCIASVVGSIDTQRDFTMSGIIQTADL